MSTVGISYKYDLNFLVSSFMFFFLNFPLESLIVYIYIYIYIKSKGIYQPENLLSNGSSRHDDAAQKI